MSGGSILIHTPDALGAKRVSDGLRESGRSVALGSDLEATSSLIAARAVDLVVADHSDDGALAQLARAATAAGVPLLAVSAAREPSQLLASMGALGLDHVLTVSTAEHAALRAVAIGELVAAIGSVLDGDDGVGRYLPRIAARSVRLRDVADRERALDQVTAYLDGLGIGAGLAINMALVADQLAANALRHGAGPVDLTYASDGNTFAVTARDRAGSLDVDAIAGALDLARPGKGLLAALHASSQLVFRLAPGRATEVTAVADLAARSRPTAAPRSVQVSIERDARVAAAVVLSESLRVDLRHQLAAMAAPALSASAHQAPPRPLRRRPKATPTPLPDLDRADIGVDTLRGILRGASHDDMALESAMRFLAGHAAAVLLYRRDGETLTPHMAAGQVARWYSLGRLEPWLRAPSTPAIVARDQSLRAFAPRKRGLDRRIMRTIGVPTASHAWALPIVTDGAADHVLSVFVPFIDRVFAIRMMIDVRAELEDALERLRTPTAPAGLGLHVRAMAGPAPTKQRAPTVPPYAHVELLYPRALTSDDYAALEIDA